MPFKLLHIISFKNNKCIYCEKDIHEILGLKECYIFEGHNLSEEILGNYIICKAKDSDPDLIQQIYG